MMCICFYFLFFLRGEERKLKVFVFKKCDCEFGSSCQSFLLRTDKESVYLLLIKSDDDHHASCVEFDRDTSRINLDSWIPLDHLRASESAKLGTVDY